jgi:hypothetical protein
MTPMTLNTKLLPDFSLLGSQVDWKYSLQNYVESRGSIELAVAFAHLFWPDFIVRNECVIRADGFDGDNFDRWWKETSGNRKAIECALNVLHVPDLVPSDDTELDDSVFDYLGSAIAEMWHARLLQLFPQRTFEVNYFAVGEQSGSGTVNVFQTV